MSWNRGSFSRAFRPGWLSGWVGFGWVGVLRCRAFFAAALAGGAFVQRARESRSKQRAVNFFGGRGGRDENKFSAYSPPPRGLVVVSRVCYVHVIRRTERDVNLIGRVCLFVCMSVCVLSFLAPQLVAAGGSESVLLLATLHSVEAFVAHTISFRKSEGGVLRILGRITACRLVKQGWCKVCVSYRYHRRGVAGKTREGQQPNFQSCVGARPLASTLISW